jgi:hypothetical protein
MSGAYPTQRPAESSRCLVANSHLYNHEDTRHVVEDVNEVAQTPEHNRSLVVCAGGRRLWLYDVNWIRLSDIQRGHHEPA